MSNFLGALHVSGYTGANGVWTATASKTLYAKWIPITYYVKFNANDGSGSMSNQTFTYGTAQNLTANAFTRTGYTFAGWNTKADGSGTNYADKASVNSLSTTNDETVNLYAQWTKVHTITWKVNGQQYGEKQEVVDGQTIGTLPKEPDAPGACSDKEFRGWTESAIVSNDGTGITYISTSTKPDGDETYHAVFATKTTGESTTTIEKTKTETFENQSASTTYNSTQNYTAANSNAGIAWKIYYGTVSESDVITGSKSAHMRWYDSAPTNLPYIESQTKVSKLKSISYNVITSDTDYKYSVSYSTNGTSWTAIATNQSASTTKQTKTHTINANGVDAYIKIAITSNSNLTDKATFRVDDVTFTYLESTTTTTTTYTDYVTSCTPQYTITLNPNGGVFAETPTGWTKEDNNYTQTIAENTQLNLPTPTHANNYEFVGWNDGADNHKGTYTATSDVTLTAQWQCIPPTSVIVDGTYHFFPDETITLTATPEGGSTPYTYQWQKRVVDQWQNIDQATSATYTKANATKEDVGHYRCVVSSGNSCEIESDSYNVKCLQLYVYYDDHTDNFNLPLTKVDATTATASVNLVNQNYTYKFKLTDGCENWYGNTGTMTSGDCTNWEMNANEYCGLTTTKYGDYLFTVDYSNLALLKVSVTYPSGNQEAGKVIYWDNHDLQWPDGKIYYRIGHSTHNGKIAMTKVPGTANLYQVTTIEYAGFEAWHIANNGCWSEDNSIYKTNTGDDWAATAATAFITNPVTSAAVTVTPSNIHSTGGEEQNNNCEFFDYNIAEGMKKHKATVIPATGGTITVSYTDHDGTAKSDFISGDRDLAHTCLLTITATPDAGYNLGTLTVNDVPFTSGNVHTLSADAEIKVVWEKKIETALSWSAPTCTATIASPSNEFPTLSTTPADLQGVQYSSSNETIATIDEDGNIRLLTAGETTIRAYKEEDETYAASNADYTLTVVASDNCRWVETNIEDIDPYDEVVVTMGSEAIVYALHNSEKIDPSPKALEVTVQDEALVGTDFANYGWYITNIDGGYQLQSCSDASKYLYGVASYITLGKNPTTFSIYQDQETGNECFVYIASDKVYYLSHGIEYEQVAWKRVTTAEHLKSNTLKFYKKVCLPENEYWVNYNLSNVTCKTTPKVETVTSTSEDFELTFEAADGYILTDDIEVQMVGGTLTTTWDKDNGGLTINNPDGGFTGNITISLAACLSLAAPENLAANEITSSSVTLSWNTVTDAQSYEVLVLDENNDEISKTTTECQITLTDLQVNSYYVWGVTPVADGYCGIQETSDFQTLQTYTVTFDKNGHENAEYMPETQTVDYGSLAQEPADDPSDNGYSFGGWYDNKNCEGDPFNFSETLITDNTVLYAKWNIVTYNIAYAGLEGATNHANNPTTYTIETPTITFLAPSTRSGYIFSGWNPTTLEKGSYGNKTITATWEEGKIVTWKADDNVIEQQTYALGDALVLPTEEIEACQGSVFVGWTDDENYSHATDAPTYVTAGSAVNADATYYAVYAEAPEGELVEEVEKTYTFSQYTAGTQYAEDEEHILDKDVTIYTTQCHFTDELRIYSSSAHNGYVVSNKLPGKIVSMGFNAGNNNDNLVVSGSTDGNDWQQVGSIATKSAYADYSLSFGKTNYTYFKLDVEGSNQIRIKSMTITYMSGSGEPSAAYANYSTTCSATYRVSYDFAEGEGICTTESVKVGNDYTICADEPTKTGYSFLHWVDEAENEYEAGEVIKNVQSNITLTAVWEANTYEITWWSNGVKYTTTSHTFDTELQLPADPYTCYGAKTFIGWTEADEVSEDGSDITYINENTNPSENKICYAVFADEKVGEPEGLEATLSFASKDQRTAFSSTQQVWEQNGIILINNKASAQSDVGDYANPARFYAASSISITAPGNITKIVFICSGDSYATALNGDIAGSTLSSSTVTVTLNETSNTFSIASLTKQVQMRSLTVTYQSTPEITRTYYTTTPTGCAEMEVAKNAYVTSASGQSVKVNVPVTATNFANDMTITAAVEDGNFSVANVSAVADGACTLTLAYKPTASNTTESATVTLTAKVGENEVTSTTFTVNGRSLPETFAVVAKVGNMWYALPEVGYEAEKHATAYPVEVDNIADPTAVTSAVANNAAWSLRQVYKAQHSNAQHDRYETSGTNFVLENKQDTAKLLNASAQGDKGSNNYLLTSAQYDNYYRTTPGLYEWTPTTTDLETYVLTNVERTGKQINISTNAAFGLHTADVATSEVRFLPIQGTYTTLAAQVVEWKENSVLVMYNGDPAQTASVSVNGGTVQTATLSAVQKDIAVYELPATSLAANPGQMLKIAIGSEQLLLSIPYIISESKVDKNILPGSTVAERQEVAKVSDLVILKGGTLTADGAKTNSYKFHNVTVYGGGKLVVPADKGFGVNTLTLRIGGVTEEGNYDYVYPEFELNINYDKAFTNTSAVINLDYVTTKSQYYTFVAPFEVKTKDIKYPVDIYGSNVAANNRGSFEFQYYDGAARAAGNSGWMVVNEDPTNGATLTAHQGYTFYGMPKKVSVNGGTSTRQKFGIHRIPMSIGAANVMEHENTGQTTAVSAYPSEHNIHKGWNLIGNPYMATITGLNNNSIQTGTIVLVDNKWQWSNAGSQANRFIVFPSNDGEWYYTSQASNATLPAFKNFFVQIGDKDATALSIPRNTPAAQLLAPARQAEEIERDIELAIVLEKDEAHSDQMDFLLNDTYGAGFDYNADFTKMMNNTQLNLYGVHWDDKLSFVAIDHFTARGSIAIGYQVPSAGEYTLRISDKPYVMLDRIEALYVTDHEMNPAVTTNLMEEDYVFQVGKAEINDTRFTISFGAETNNGNGGDITTDMSEIDIHSQQPQKFLYDGRLYILRDGKVYSATGHEIKTINE